MKLYDRIASIEIGPPGGTGFRFTGNRILFQVDKSDRVEANKARVEIMNLSEDTRNRIKTLDDQLIIRAGYVEATGEEVLFTGRVSRVEHRYPVPDIVSRIEAGDGATELRERRSSVSFSGGTDMQQIVQKLVDDFGLEIRDSIDVPRLRWTQGFSYAGPTREGLRKVLDRAGLDYSIQNGFLQIVERGGANRKTAVLVSSSTGLLSSPSPLDDQGGSLTEAKRKPGWAFRTLLQPQIEPGGTVQLESREARGMFRVNSVRHQGDTHGADWFSEVEVSEL